MIIEDNPLTRELHENWRKRIVTEFSNSDFSDNIDFICLISYLESSPQRFFSKVAFAKYLSTLESIKKSDPKLLSDIIRDAEPLLSISNRILAEVNNMEIHDVLLPKDTNELINFIDSKIHYNLLKIYETPLYHLCYILAKFYWIKDNKGIDGLDLFSATEQLKKIGFDFIGPIYLHDVRNGIAHGKIIYSDSDITYIDKRNHKTTIYRNDIVRTFDKALDIINGFCLAFKVFCFTNPGYFEKFKISIPQSILLEELQAKANSPAWVITNCLESVAMQNKKQLMIFVKNDNWDLWKVNWICFATACWAEALTKSYDRIFISLESKHSKYSSVGWAAYDGVKLKKLRESRDTQLNEYKGVLEDDLLYFAPKIKFPQIIYKFGTYASIININLPLAWRNYRNTYFPKLFKIRETRIHSKGRFAVVQDPSIIINPKFENDIEQLIRFKKKKIIKDTIKYSRKQMSFFSLTRYLPVKSIRVFIYDTDLRIRNLRDSGLIPELVATIEVNTSKQIRTIDIFGGTVEQIGKYRIVWNRKWIKKGCS